MKFSTSPRTGVRAGVFVACRLPLVLFFTSALFVSQAQERKISGTNSERARVMLNAIKSDIAKNYYDVNFHGIDLEARFKTAEEKIKTTSSLGQALSIIAQTLVDFNDSHLYFVPPSRPSRVDYGWQMQMIGESCYVSAVRPNSDADKKGIHPGDEVWTVDDYGPTRDNLWKIKYVYYSLRPQSGMRIVIHKPDGKEQQQDVMAKVEQGKLVLDLASSDIFELMRESENEDRLHRQRYVELGEDLFIWKMPQFDLQDAEVDDLMGKARKHKALVLDLRGNGGGAIQTLTRLVSNVFDHDVRIADRQGRKEMKPMLAKTRGEKAFKGSIVVIVDSESASSSEVFARLMQLEKRGTVIGDRSMGKVMESRFFNHQIGVDTVAFYGVSITDADVIMSDGKSLEQTGVTPDEITLPTPADMAAKRDPVLAHAASLVGVKLDPEKAGTLFPVEWRSK